MEMTSFKNRKQALAAVRKDPMDLQYVSAQYQQECDNEIAYAAVSACAEAARYLCDKLRSDREFILRVIKKKGGAILEYLPDEIRNDRDFILSAVSVMGNVLLHIPEEMRCDRAFVLESVRRNGYALVSAPDEFRSDREIALAAVTECANAFPGVAPELRADRDFMLAAVSANGRAIRFAELVGRQRLDTEQ